MINIKHIFFIIIFACFIIFASKVNAGTFANFDFNNNDVTQGFNGWNYSDIGENPCGVYDGENQSKMCSVDDVNGHKQSMYYYYNGYNTDHMGWMRWGYIDSSSHGIKGNALSLTFTGGAFDDNGTVAYSGLEVKGKSQYENYVAQNQNPFANRILPGDFTLYFHSNDANNHFYPFQQLIGNDRLSVWVLPSKDSPFTIDKQSKLYSGRPEQLFSWYPFVIDSNGDHYYHDLSNINMGGWIHFLFDAHPLHNNSGDTNPYSYYRSGGTDYPGNAVAYFNNVNGFSLRGKMGTDLPSPSSILIDEFEAYKVAQPENDETIAGIGVGYDPNSKMFDIAFNDKYRCTSGCESIYEVRYSFEPITNSNYDNASIARVTNFDRTKNNSNGLIYKPNSGYSQIWAAVELADSDKTQLIDGKTIYFALKDKSDRSELVDKDSYDLETTNVEGIGPVRRVDLIKTIDYTIYPVFRQLLFKNLNLEDGHLNNPYSHKIDVEGGQLPYTFQILSGNLPTGLTLLPNGTIQGIPIQKGTFNVQISVSESSSFSQQKTVDFTINIYDSEICNDSIDNDLDGLRDCADSDCYLDSNCSIKLVDFSNPNIFGLENWNILLKDAYTNYVSAGPGGMTVTIGNSGQYNFQGVRGTSKTFKVGDRIFIYWYNNSSSNVTFKPKISFNDPDRPVAGSVGTWYLMNEISINPQDTKMSEFIFDGSNQSSYDLVNVSVNQDNNQVIVADQILYVPAVQVIDDPAPHAPTGLTLL